MRRFLRIVRYKEWFDSKWNIYFYVYLLFWIRHPGMDTMSCIKGLVAVMGFAFFLLAFGYAFNEYSDAHEDRLAGKPNQLAALSRSRQLFVLSILLLAGIALPVLLFPGPGMLLIVCLSFLMAFLYSYRRFKIKQCGIWGLAVSSLAQRVCPMFSVFYLFDDFSATSLLVAILSFIVGLRWILIHQAADMGNDKVSRTKSFVGSLNDESKLLYIITIVFFCELSLLVSILLLNAHLSWALIVPVAYLMFQIIVMPFWKKIGWKRMILSYDFAPLADFYYLWAGLYAVLALTLRIPLCVLFLLPVLYFGYRYIILDYKYLKLNYAASRGLLRAPDDTRY